MALPCIAVPTSLAKEQVKVQIVGRFYNEPATVRIKVAVEPKADNRMLRVEADGDQYFRASDLVLEGDKEARHHTVEFKNLPAGDYVIRATVHDRTSVTALSETPLLVLSSH